MKSMLWLAVLLAVLIGGNAYCLSSEAYSRRPRLVVVLVIDQFRSDFLTRLEKKFVPEGKGVAGFQTLMRRGAWFPFASFDLLQSMTCPGHAAILTGAHPFSHGIGANKWFDPASGKLVYCVQDDKHGLSPTRLRAPTLGDEIKLEHPGSKVVSLALKDRAAILLGGHKPNLALWYDSQKAAWVSSAFYGNGRLPAWVERLNRDIEKAGRKPDPAGKSLLEAFRGTKLTFAAALAALRAEGLGKVKDRSDLLAISLSSHDILGHQKGAIDAGMEELTLLEDKELAAFLRALSREIGGLEDIVVALTADHGAPPTMEQVKDMGLEGGRLNAAELAERVEKALSGKFGAPPSGQHWVLSEYQFHFFLNRELANSRKVTPPALENAAKDALGDQPGAHALFTRSEYDLNLLPPGSLGDQIRHSYVPGQSGDLILVPRPFYVEGEEGQPVVHMTGWGYDRTVPILLMGRAFKPGVYSGGSVIDIAPTLAFLLGILPPAMSEGHVLSQSLR